MVNGRQHKTRHRIEQFVNMNNLSFWHEEPQIVEIGLGFVEDTGEMDVLFNRQRMF